MPLPPATNTDVNTLQSMTRVLVHGTQILDVQRVDGSPIKYRVNLLAPIKTLFSERNVSFAKEQWEFDTADAAMTFARTTALTIYQQYKAITDAAEIIRGL